MPTPPSAGSETSRLYAGLDAGRPLAELTALFANRADALAGYADWTARHFGRPRSDRCEVCDGARASHEETWVWEAVANTRGTVVWSFLVSALTLALGMIYTRFYLVRFVTRHGFCERCARSLRWRRWFAQVGHHLLFALLIVSLLAVVPLAVFAGAMTFFAPELVPGTLLLCAAALVPLGLSVAGFEANRRGVIPARLRTVGQFPFVLREARRVTPGRDVPAPRPSPAR